MGTLTEVDKQLPRAELPRASSSRDYRRVAQAHLEAGWVPAGHARRTSSRRAIRAVCEPIFDAAARRRSPSGALLLRLFQTSRRFNVEIQPQLVMLQKTLLNIEGLGRELDPDLDLWTDGEAVPRALDGASRSAWRGLLRTLRSEAPHWATMLPAAAAPAAPRCSPRTASERIEEAARPSCSCWSAAATG